MEPKQVIIITGASSGIGLALAKEFAKNGSAVVATSRRITSSGALSASANTVLIDGEVSEEATARKVVDAALKAFGRIDVLINNAGIFVPKAIDEYTTEEYWKVVNTNLTGFFVMTREVVRQMKRQASGQILNISTSLVEQPISGVNAALTSLTKGGLNAVTKELAIELSAHNIRVNAIAPGIIDTPMHAPESHGFLKGLHPIPRLGTVKEIVDAARYLIEAEFVSGEVLHVDGGAHAGKW